MLKKGILLTIFASMFSLSHSEVTLNEMMPCNVSTLMNDDYNYTGWVEVYNPGPKSVDLKGYKFKNTTPKKVKWEWIVNYSVKIDSAGYAIIFFDEKSKSGHAPYKIDSDRGCGLFLYNPAGVMVDSFASYPEMIAHISYGKYNGSVGYMEPSPKDTNTFCVKSSSSICPDVSFMGFKPGAYSSVDGKDAVTLACVSKATSRPLDGYTIYYTTNGSEPLKGGKATKLYSEPIKIKKNTVIRAKAYKNGYISGPINTGSYLFVDSKHQNCGGGFTVPIVSLVTDSANFYDKKIGIYVRGTNGIPSPSTCITGSANYFRDWKRSVNFEFIDIEEGSAPKDENLVSISQQVEAAVMGGCSRQYEYKSLKINASKKQGSSSNYLPYDFFKDPKKTGNKYKAIQVRNGGNAYEGIRIRDGVMQAIIDEMDIDRQAYRPCAFYINGVYGGLMGLRERTNKDFVFSNYGYDEEDIDVIEITKKDSVHATCGTVDAYTALLEAAATGQSSEDYLKKMDKLMDVNEYIDYMSFEQFIVNTDWPGNNTKIWRNRNNGRFRWLVFDTDFGFGMYDAWAENYCDPQQNMILFALADVSYDRFNWANSTPYQTQLFRSLMKNEQFRQKFVTRYLINLKKYFNYDKVCSVMDSVASLAEYELCATNTYANLSGAISDMKSFAKTRTQVVPGHIRNAFGFDDIVDLKISSNVKGAKYLLNDELIDSDSYQNNYFSGMRLRVTPIAPVGYEFKSWDVSTLVRTVFLGDSTSWKYHYAAEGPAGAWTSLDYDDSEWNSGKGRFGYSPSIHIDTELDYGDKDDKYLTSYFRGKFTVSDPSLYDTVYLSIDYDDGYIIYINGKEFDRVNLPEGEVSYKTLALTYVNDEVKKIAVPQSYLLKGENVVAVEMHQNVNTSSDLVFKLIMNGETSRPSPSDNVFDVLVAESLVMKAEFVKSGEDSLRLFINEICASNDTVKDDCGLTPDWIEIYNDGNGDVNLSGMFISDDYSNLRKHMISYDNYSDMVIPAKGYMMFWADNEMWRGPNHIDFKLSVSMPTMIYLSRELQNGSLEIIDSVEYVSHDKNLSYGRATDASETWTLFDVTTPNATNNSGQRTFCAPETNSLVDVVPSVVQTGVVIKGLDAEGAMIKVVSASGVEVYSKFTVDGNVNLSALASGNYLVKVITDDDVFVKKIIKK